MKLASAEGENFSKKLSSGEIQEDKTRLVALAASFCTKARTLWSELVRIKTRKQIMIFTQICQITISAQI